MHALIVYYSMSGNAKQVAEKIARQTGADILALIPVKHYPDKGFKKFIWGGKSAVMGEKPALQPYSFDADKYDTVIFGTPVWASSFAPPLRTFIETHREALRQKQKAAYVCFMGSGGQKALDKLRKALDTEQLLAEMALINPKEHDNTETNKTIEDFCRRLTESST